MSFHYSFQRNPKYFDLFAVGHGSCEYIVSYLSHGNQRLLAREYSGESDQDDRCMLVKETKRMFHLHSLPSNWDSWEIQVERVWLGTTGTETLQRVHVPCDLLTLQMISWSRRTACCASTPWRTLHSRSKYTQAPEHRHVCAVPVYFAPRPSVAASLMHRCCRPCPGTRLRRKVASCVWTSTRSTLTLSQLVSTAVRSICTLLGLWDVIIVLVAMVVSCRGIMIVDVIAVIVMLVVGDDGCGVGWWLWWVMVVVVWWWWWCWYLWGVIIAVVVEVILVVAVVVRVGCW